ncbi:ADP-ribosylation factor-binding protein GGA3-like isoform X1 [Scophthalmus maximus]|uniref:ADP-ribosylation factor-binding protein GGA3-like isoform X1 n=2 Tax=Scophthalmus maximus TaxID=52904 RepID=UPI001FA83D62|nr:ADP-ribosylation factor-binding protein GGA3-like isoform X1 [Scophthalmus maximus]
MATGESAATFESWLHQATDPNNEGDRWDCIQGFYQLVNQETDGPQVAIRLLAHKIQSPQEKEALQAVTVLEACMNNCGKRFHSEAAKYRFLNELIKVLTPKYFGAWTPQSVKEQVIKVLYGWTLWLKDEPKIQEVYGMLKKQGLVKEDPKLPDTLIMAPPPRRSSGSVFDQEDKAELLARLLKSARLEDLETANRLIKETIKEEQEKAEKVQKRDSTLKEVASSTKQLRELLDRHAAAGTSLPPGDDVKALYERCDRLRPGLFRLASDTMDDDDALAQILAANDDLALAVNAYKEQVGRRECNGGGGGRGGRRKSEEEEEVRGKTSAPTSPREIKSYHLIDLSALDSPPTHRKADSPLPCESPSPPLKPRQENAFPPAPEQDLTELEFDVSQQTSSSSSSYYDELMQLNEDDQKRSSEQNGGRGVLLRARGCGGSGVLSNGTNTWCLPPNQQFNGSGSTYKTPTQEVCVETECPPQLLKHVFVPMDTIKSSHLEPITLYDQGGVHVSLHFARNSPAGRPGFAVVVISTVNTSAVDVNDFLFQAAVPKTMSVKLQPASGTHLPPYNPLLPPPAISQVVLLANPHRRKVRLRYKLTLTRGDQQLDETGEIDNFPDWNSLIGQ